jgi:cytochrome c553
MLAALALPSFHVNAEDRAQAMARAETIVQGQCFICHGMEGESSTPAFPRLAGQNARYVARQLADYQSGKRTSTAMQAMVTTLNEADFDALGLYFATRPTVVHTVDDPQIAKVGEYIYHQGNADSGLPACATCHGPRAYGSETLPRLAGQHAKYTETQLRQFNKRERTNDNAVMHTVASKLTELELKAVSAYVSGLN